MTPSKNRRTERRCAVIEALERRVLLSTYFVSPGGNDANPGTSAATPWQTVAKVDATAFQPGDQILFQRGGQWHESLVASSDGAPNSPILYGAYGDSSLAKPLFIGSDALDPGAFNLVSGNTYSLPSKTPINWIFDNHLFTHNSQVALRAYGSGNPNVTADNINYVNATPESFYYDVPSAVLYINLGSAPSGHTITAAVREDAVFNNGHSYLTFMNLAVTETAHDQAGYAFRAQGGTNVQILDCDATLAGKHHFGDIDSTNFLGEDLTATSAPPDLGFGGASGFVTFSDSIGGRANNTAQWINVTWTNTNGAYPAFITHGDTGAVASVLVQNLVSLSGYGSGIVCYSTQPSEVVKILGGHLDGGTIELQTNNSVIDGVLLSGADAAISLEGDNDVAQNCVLSGIAPSPYAGLNGGIVDAGHNNTIRFNTFQFSTPNGPAIGILNNTSDTHIYGNIFDDPAPIWLLYNGGPGELDSDFNVFGTTYRASPTIVTGDILHVALGTFQQWQSFGFDAHSLVANPEFMNPGGGDFSLQSTSPAVDLYLQSPDTSTTSITTDFSGSLRPQGAGYDAGAFELPEPPLILTGSAGSDQFYLRVISTSPAILGVWQNSGHNGTGTPSISAPLSQISTISINGDGGADQLALDFSGGSFGAPGVSWTSAGGAFTVSTIGSPSPQIIPLEVGASTTMTYAPAGFAGNFAINDNTSLILSAAPAGTGVHALALAALNIADGATAAVASPISASDRAVLVVGSLDIAGGGELDLGANDLIVRNGSLSAITQDLATGLNAGGGYWNGPGIDSSAAAGDASRLTTLGVMLNDNGTGLQVYGTGTLSGLFDGQTPSAADVLVKYTVWGDTDLTGQVDGADYSRIDNGFNMKLTGWINGDFNYDNTINGADFSLIDNSFNAVNNAFNQSTEAASPPAIDASAIVDAIATPVTAKVSASPGNAALGTGASAFERSFGGTFFWGEVSPSDRSVESLIDVYPTEAFPTAE